VSVPFYLEIDKAIKRAYPKEYKTLLMKDSARKIIERLENYVLSPRNHQKTTKQSAKAKKGTKTPK